MANLAVKDADGKIVYMQATGSGTSVDPYVVAHAVTVASLPLPAGAATDATLAAASAKLPATLGQKTSANSLAVTVASDQSALPVNVGNFPATQSVSAVALPLPTGAATETTLAAASAKLPATLGQKTSANSLAVTVASDQSALPVNVNNFPATQPVSAANLPLPAGAATEATLAAASAKLPAALGATTAAASISVTTATNDPVLTAYGGVTETAPASDTASSGLNGRLQRIAQRLTSLIALLPGTLGQKTSANSLAVTVASDQSALTVAQATAANLKAQVVYADVTATDKSGTIATGGTAQTAIALNANRRAFWIQNLSAGDLWISDVGTATAASPSLKIVAGGLYESMPGNCPTSAISIIGATTSQAFAAREYT